MNPQRILGLLLVAMGGALLLATTTDVGGEVVVLGIGLGFLAAYLATWSYGLLIPAGILTGLGAGLVGQSLGMRGGIVPLGLGLGFVAIAVIDGLGRREAGSAWWWPLIPGGILTVAGGSDVLRANLGSYLVPLGLIVVGLVFLVRPRDRRRRRDEVTQAPPPPGAT